MLNASSITYTYARIVICINNACASAYMHGQSRRSAKKNAVMLESGTDLGFQVRGAGV